MTPELEKVHAIFRAEAEEQLASLEQELLSLETSPSSESLQGVFRLVHTLKGGAGSVGFHEVVELAHTLEDLLSKVEAGAVVLHAGLGGLLLQAVDALRELVGLAPQGDPSLRMSPEDVRQLLSCMARSARATDAGGGDCCGGGARQEPESSGAHGEPAASRERTLRVGLDRERILERVTELSGRGVGMDVVKRNVEALRGSLTVDSRPGGGTTFTLRLPLTLSIIEGFYVGVGEETYVIPMESVRECVELPAAERRPGRTGVLNLRGGALPFLRLREHFAVQGPPQPRENVVVLGEGRVQAGFAVDTLLGHGQTVIEPLGKLCQGLPGLAGSTLLGDGRVALILDVPALLQQALVEAPAASAA